MIGKSTPLVAVMVMDNGDEEVLRMKIPGLRQFSYVCPRGGMYHMYIVREWGDDWRADAVDAWRYCGVAEPGAVRHYHPPSVRATWGDVQ